MSRRHITPEQFQQYQQQWNQPVEDGDVEGQWQKSNAAYWVAYCHWWGTGGIQFEEENVNGHRILEQVIQEQDSIDGDNHHDNTGKHRCLLAWTDDGLYDHARRRQLFRQAIPRLEMEVQLGGNDENYQQAAFYLGQCLFFGYGVDKDCLQGIRWLEKAAELGHGDAQFSIYHDCFYKPFVAEIVSWWQHIADQNNNPWAQCRLGICYKNGNGVKKDFVKAVERYNKAIAQGYDRATWRRQTLLNCLSPEERSRTLGCVARNQKIEKAMSLIQQSFVGGVPLSFWPHALESFQNQENPPWEAPSPTFLSLKDAIIPKL